VTISRSNRVWRQSLSTTCCTPPATHCIPLSLFLSISEFPVVLIPLVRSQTEDGGDVDMDKDCEVDEASSSLEQHVALSRCTCRVGIVSDAPPAAPLDVNADDHIIIRDAQGGFVRGDGVGIEVNIVCPAGAK